MFRNDEGNEKKNFPNRINDVKRKGRWQFWWENKYIDGDEEK